MPAPPNFDYVMCPDGSTAIGDNCGSSLSLNTQEQIAYAKMTSDPVFQAAINADIEPYPTKLLKEEPKVETNLGNGLTKSQKWAWVIGLTFASWGLIYWSQKQSNK